MLCQKNKLDFVKKAVFRAKSRKILHSKGWIFFDDFLLHVAKDHFKMCETTISNYHAMENFFLDFRLKMLILEAKLTVFESNSSEIGHT
jgi:hypothetical protein